MAQLKGRVAIVTGAGAGLGRAHALWLARQGASIVANVRRDGENLRREITALGGEAIIHEGSVEDWDASRDMVKQAVERFGDLHIVIANAGIAGAAAMGALGEIDPARWQHMMDVNLTGTMTICHWAAEYWRRQGPSKGRSIVVVSSPAGTLPMAGIQSYNVSKAGVLAIMIAGAEELAPLGVRVNGISPIARTPMSLSAAELAKQMPVDADFDRFAPDHVSELVGYLVSDQCRFTGRLFGVEGDMVALHDSWNITQVITNDRKGWTLDSLTSALADLPVQQSVLGMGPGQLYQTGIPSDEALSAINS